MKAKIKNPYIKKDAKINNGPLNMISVISDNGLIYVNSNGIFDVNGEPLRTKKAKELLGL
tara:strand:- start:1124 stop:1303 length:180 start_codon:yes stop_codon:yes gene_type:complete